MTHLITKRIKLSIVLMALAFVVKSQDLHYSQFYNSPLNLNPANTGIFNGDKRVIMSVRDQWRFVPVPWFTMSGSYDFKITPDKEKIFYGLGVNFNYDKQGDSKLVLAGLNVSGSLTYILNKSNLITFGALIGGARRGFSPTNLTWDKQWNGSTFDPNAGSGENFDVEALNFVETGAGINYRMQKSSRTKLDVGIGAYHLYQPTTDFYNADDKKLPMHLTFSGIGSVKLSRYFDLELNAMHQQQDEYGETLLGVLGKVYLNSKRGKNTQVHAGVGYRTSGSWIPTLALEYKQWFVSVSYDVDNTEINNFLNSNKGGPEVHLRYIIKNVKPMNQRKICPIY